MLALATMSAALAQDASTEDLVDLSLEQLGDIEITSVSKRAERLSDAATSVFVITSDDIRRSGAVSLPEILRLAPNLEVARVSAHAYAISSRGFNNSIGNKLQVLLDGRILYTPLFSGVFWDVPDTMLEDIERIEVISGPGATLWGANAVNGVINVITRRASETQGGLASVHAGNLERNYAVRFGGAGSNVSYRIHGRFFDRDPTLRTSGLRQNDAWERGEVGFRADWGAPASGFTLQGAAYRGALDTASTEDLRTSGGHLLGRWTRQLESGSGMRLQAYFDRTSRDIPASIRERLNIYEVEFQHDIAGIDGHAPTWGIGHRSAADRVTNAPGIAFLPADRDLYWTSIFAQDEIELRGERLKLIGGVRVERNSFTGSEILPTLRLAWKPSSSRLVWSAVSRAVRTPSRFDRELFAPASPPYQIAGGPGFRSEVAEVLEIGYRSQPSARVSYSVTAFHHDYDSLRSFEQRPSGEFVIGNRMQGTGDGLEAWGTWRASDRWQLSAGASWLDLDLRLRPDSTDPTGVRTAGNDPEQQWMLRSSWQPSARMELDASVRHVGALPNPRVEAYTAVDARFGWRPGERVEVSLTAQNLLDSGHVESGDPLTASEFERAFRLGITWWF